MNIQTNEIENCKIQVLYTASKDKVLDVENEIIKTFKEVKVSGFRKGKATTAAIKTKFKKELNEMIKSELINQANDDILFETKIRPIGRPQVNNISFDGNTFKCDVTYLKKPDFTLGQYKDLEVAEPHIENNLSDLNAKFLENLRENQSSVRAFTDTDFIQKGDKVTLTYTLEDGTSEEGVLYTAGDNGFIGFDDNIYGMSPGDEREFSVIHDGKQQTCKVVFHMGMKKVPAELNDDLAKRFGHETLEQLINAVSSISESSLKSERDAKVAEQIIAKLVESHEIDCPKWLIDMEVAQLKQKSGQAEVSDEELENVTREAIRNVKLSLILDSIQIEEPAAKLSEMEAINGIAEALKQKGVSNPREWMDRATKNGVLFGLIAKYKNDYTIQWLVDNCKKIS